MPADEGPQVADLVVVEGITPAPGLDREVPAAALGEERLGPVGPGDDPAAQTLNCQGESAPLPPEGNVIQLRILVDRCSLEIFGNGGAVCMVIGHAPEDTNQALAIFARNETVKLSFLEVCEVDTIWPIHGNEKDKHKSAG